MRSAPTCEPKRRATVNYQSTINRKRKKKRIRKTLPPLSRVFFLLSSLCVRRRHAFLLKNRSLWLSLLVEMLSYLLLQSGRHTWKTGTKIDTTILSTSQPPLPHTPRPKNSRKFIQ